MNLYYIILAFGALLLLYVSLGWIATRKKINERDKTFAGTAEFITKFKNKIILWQYYFTAGNTRSIFISTLISILIFIVFFVVNNLYIRINRNIFIVIYITLFVLVVWKFGQRKNRKLFDEMFPEVIQILNAASSAGAGLLQALERCGKDIPGPLGEEFKNIYRRLAIGEEPMSVFDDSYSRYPYKEFYFFISIIRTNLAKGGQMREVISRLGRVIADGKKMEQKKKAMTSEARMSAFIVASFPIAFFLFMQVVMPDNFDFLINDPKGRYVLYYVFGSETIGMLIIWWLMRKST